MAKPRHITELLQTRVESRALAHGVPVGELDYLDEAR
jgi:hypothetical protein